MKKSILVYVESSMTFKWKCPWCETHCNNSNFVRNNFIQYDKINQPIVKVSCETCQAKYESSIEWELPINFDIGICEKCNIKKPLVTGRCYGCKDFSSCADCPGTIYIRCGKCYP